MRPRSLAFRVGVAATSSLLAVVAVFALLLHHEMGLAIASWERAQMAALGHHLAEMLRPLAEEERQGTVDRVAPMLSRFGISVQLASVPERAGTAVRIPVEADGASVELRATEQGSNALSRRLAPLYLALTVGLVLAMLLAVQASIYWCLVRPLRGIQRQISQMGGGRWWVPARLEGVAEVAQLASGLESLGESMELKIGQWAVAERRAGMELARHRLATASRDLRGQARLLFADLQARNELSPPLRRHLRSLQKSFDRLENELSQPLEALGLDAKWTGPVPLLPDSGRPAVEKGPG